MKTIDVRAKSEDELKQQLLDLRKESFNLRFQRVSGQLAIASGSCNRSKGISTWVMPSSSPW